MNYQVTDLNGKIAGKLNHLGHLVASFDPGLERVFARMYHKGITVLFAPSKKIPDGILADGAKTTEFKDASPELIFSELAFAGFKVAPQGKTSTYKSLKVDEFFMERQIPRPDNEQLESQPTAAEVRSDVTENPSETNTEEAKDKVKKAFIVMLPSYKKQDRE